jgi:hypothetical protein
MNPKANPGVTQNTTVTSPPGTVTSPPAESPQRQRFLRRLELVKRFPDTLLLSPDPVGVYDEIVVINKILSLLRKAIIKGKITPDDFLEIQRTYTDEVAQPVWQGIVSVVPHLAIGTSPIQNWRKFDDPVHEKEILIARSFKLALVPKAEVVGILGILHKLLYKISIEMNTTTDPETVYQLGAIGNIYREFKSRLEEQNNNLIAKYSIALPKRKPATFAAQTA